MHFQFLVHEVNLLPKPKFGCLSLKRRVLIGKECELSSGGGPTGKKADSYLKANFKVSAWPREF